MNTVQVNEILTRKIRVRMNYPITARDLDDFVMWELTNE